MRMTEGSRPRPIRSRGAGDRAQQKGQHDRESDRDQNRLSPIKGRNNQYNIPEGDQRGQCSGAAASAPEIGACSWIFHIAFLALPDTET